MKVLFVCTGNTCRSPMAEILLRAKIEAAGQAEMFAAASAGLAAVLHEPAAAYAKQAMRRMGLSLAEHRARPLTPALVWDADLLLTMTARHKAAIVGMLPETAGKIYTLAEYAAAGGGDVPDPFGREQSAYDACAVMLAAQVDQLWEKIKGKGGRR